MKKINRMIGLGLLFACLCSVKSYAVEAKTIESFGIWNLFESSTHTFSTIGIYSTSTIAGTVLSIAVSAEGAPVKIGRASCRERV